jgi:hypothetical protein
MPVPGYDPNDLDNELENALTDTELRERLTDEEFRRYEEGENLIDLLDEDDIDEVLGEA